MSAVPNRIPKDSLDQAVKVVAAMRTQIARAISTRKGKVTVFVPHYAMSGGTLLALAADEIVMSDYAVFWARSIRNSASIRRLRS